VRADNDSPSNNAKMMKHCRIQLVCDHYRDASDTNVIERRTRHKRKGEQTSGRSEQFRLLSTEIDICSKHPKRAIKTRRIGFMMGPRECGVHMIYAFN